MNYAKLEDAIVTRLEPLKQHGFDVVALPESDYDFTRAFKSGRVTVAYKMSLFNDDGFNGRPMIFSTAQVVQKETAELEVLIQCRVLRGASGIHSLKDYVMKRLVGYEPDSWGRIYCKEFRYIEQGDGVWTYALTIHTQALAVQVCDPSTDPLITQIAFDEAIGNVVTVDNSITTAAGLLKFKEHSTISVQFKITEDDEPKDLTGYTFRFGIKQFLGDTMPLIIKPGTVSGNIVSALIPAVENILLPGNYKGVFEMVSGGAIENEIVVQITIEPQLI